MLVVIPQKAKYMNTDDEHKQASPKDRFIAHMEELLIMNLLLPDERLPPERLLAQQMNVSRPVIHEALLELEKRGLIIKRPRHGWIVNHFHEEGSLTLLNSLYRFAATPTIKKIDSDLEDVRRIILSTSLKKYFTQTQNNANEKLNLPKLLRELIIKTEKIISKEGNNIKSITEQDFIFYRSIIEAGNNIVFVLLFNSSRELYHQKLETFFLHNHQAIQQALTLKKQLTDFIQQNEQEKAVNLIQKMTSYNTYDIKQGGF